MEMLVNGSENRKVFSKVVPVQVKDGFSSLPRESHLLLTMEWQKISSGTYNEQVLAMSLTDNDDPFFLYNMQLTFEDYEEGIKKKEDLEIEFSLFPGYAIEFIEKCFEKDPKSNIGHTLILEVNGTINMGREALLIIKEYDGRRHMKHLTFKFIPANESAVRQYLVSNFRSLKEDKRKLQNNLAFMEQDLKNKLAACQATLTTKVQELGEVIKQHEVELKEKDYKHQLELKEERDRYNSMHKEEIYRLEKETKEKECNLVKEIKQYEDRVNILETLNKGLDDKISKLESANKELEFKLHSSEDENNSLKKKLQNSKHKHDQLQSEIQTRKLSIQQLEEKIRELQQELRSKGRSIEKLTDQVEDEIASKKIVEKELENLKLSFEMSETTRQELEVEKERFNNMIVHLEEEVKELTKEEKNKSHLTAKYKKIIEEKNNALMEAKRKHCELELQLQSQNVKVENLTESRNNLEEKIKQKEKTIKDQENVIKWLNRQMTENCIFNQYTGTPHLATSPSSLAQKKLDKINSESPPAGEKAASKSVRTDSITPVSKQSGSTPTQLHRTPGIDSAYRTASLQTNQATPEILAGNHNMNVDPSNFKNDSESEQALQAAFAKEGGTFKHSTAKKATRPVKSFTPKSSKKR